MQPKRLGANKRPLWERDIVGNWGKKLRKGPSNKKCKFCSSGNIVKYGRYKASQLWMCKNCHRKFSDSSDLFGMKTPVIQTLTALNMYYNKGMPFHAIRDQINKKYHAYLSETTIYRWIDKYARLGFNSVEAYKPKIIGDDWVASETIVEVLGKRYCLLDLVDLDTCFLLNTAYLVRPNERFIKRLIKPAIDKAGKKPKSLVLLEQGSCLEKLKSAGDADFKDIKITSANKAEASAIAKRCFSSFANRDKLICRVRRGESIQRIVNGWLFHYNFRRVHESLSGKSPAEISSGL